MKVLVVSENASYLSGGAEKSLRQFCAKNFKPQCQFTFLVKGQKKEILEYDFLSHPPKYIFLKADFIKIFLHFPFFYTQIILIANFLKMWNEVGSCEILLTQNRWAPYVICLTLARSILTQRKSPRILYFVRDEKCLNYYTCYSSGFRRFAWYLRHIIETPSRLLHRTMTKLAFKNSCVIFNSEFMERFSKQMQLYPKESKILHPQIERINKLATLSWLNEQSEVVRELYRRRSKNIVMIGDEVIKGFNVFESLSSSHVNLTFICFSKKYRRIEVVRDIIFLPWTYQAGAPFLLASTVIVPSVWNEAYGRVVVEAKQYNCNILISDRGGLKEALGTYPRGEICVNMTAFRKVYAKLNSACLKLIKYN
jgi:hypothetical protein